MKAWVYLALFGTDDDTEETEADSTTGPERNDERDDAPPTEE